MGDVKKLLNNLVANYALLSQEPLTEKAIGYLALACRRLIK